MALAAALCVAAFAVPAICEALTFDETTQEYVIATPQDLIDFRDMVNRGEYRINARLEGNIDLTQADGTPLAWTPIGTGDGYSASYKGKFNGQGYAVTGYVVSTAAAADGNAQVAGFFGALSGATVSNLTVSGNVEISEALSEQFFYAGGVAGVIMNGTTLESCVNNGVVNIDVKDCNYNYVGGIVGSLKYYSESFVKNSNNNGTVTLKTTPPDGSNGALQSYVGGITGKFDAGEISNCVNNASVSADVDKTIGGSGACMTYAGGIAGIGGYMSKEVAIDGCSNLGSVAASSKTTKGGNTVTGGILGQSDLAAVSNCANSGTVSSEKTNGAGAQYSTAYAGGIVGINGDSSFGSESTITNCANTGAVSTGSGKNAGAIAGMNQDEATFEDCAWAEDTATSALGSNKNSNITEDNIKENAVSVSAEQTSEIVTTVAFTASEFEVAEGETAVITLDTFPGSTSQFDSYVKDIVVSIEPSTAAELVSQEGKNITIRGLAAGETATVKISAQLYASDFSNASEIKPSSTPRDVTAQCTLKVASQSEPAPAPSTPQHSGGGGGGCSAGFGALALLAVVPLLRMRKR